MKEESRNVKVNKYYYKTKVLGTYSIGIRQLHLMYAGTATDSCSTDDNQYKNIEIKDLIGYK